MENLTKQQLILLALLVSFVSSIATGIVTVSLLNQAPPAVTQTINRIVERTVETVTPAASGGPQVIKETIVVSESDAAAEAIEKAAPSIIRVERTRGGDNWNFTGLGIILSADGRLIAKTSHDRDYRYRAALSDGSFADLRFVDSGDRGFAVFSLEPALVANRIPALADTAGLKLGQSMIAIAGESSNSIDEGIVSNIVSDGGAVARIMTTIDNLAFADQSVLINLSGEIVGFKAGLIPEEGYMPVNILQSFFE